MNVLCVHLGLHWLDCHLHKSCKPRERWGESPARRHIRVHSVWLQMYQSIFWRSRPRQVFIPPDTIPLSAWPWTCHLLSPLCSNKPPSLLWRCPSSLLRCENGFPAQAPNYRFQLISARCSKKELILYVASVPGRITHSLSNLRQKICNIICSRRDRSHTI